MTAPWPLRGDLGDAEILDLAATFAHATPFPHVVLDGWIDPAALDTLAGLFDLTTGWKNYEDGKRANGSVVSHPIVDAFNSPAMCELLTAITGVEGLQGDQTIRGGGLHALGPRG